MKITNRSGFPQALVNAVENDQYTGGKGADFSCTGLLQPPRISALKKKHKAELEEDVEDRFWALLGQAVHTVLERANKVGLVEKRFFAEFAGKTVSAQIDTLDLKDGILTDWKLTTAWKFKAGVVPAEWTAQLNIQALILRRNGHEVKELQIVGLLRDHSKPEALRNADYPQKPVIKVPIEMWTDEQTASFIESRIAVHLLAEKDLPLCTSEDRWAKPDMWAVMKGKRAINGGVQLSMELAEKICSENPGTRVEFRPGASVRCGLYCPVAKFCTQFAKLNKKKEDEELKDAI